MYSKANTSLPNTNNSLIEWITDSIKDSIVVVGKDTKILYVNAQWEKILGLKFEDIRGQKLLDIEPSSPLNDVIKNGQPIIGQYIKLKKTGLNVITNSLPIFDNNGLSGGVGIFRETSQLEQLMTELFSMKNIIEYYEEQLKLKNSLPPDFASLIGENQKFLEALIKAYRASESAATVLILGESGVGKNLLSRAIHMSSNRKDRPFIDINCAAIPENLLESELFGYVGGSFTGARKEGKAGKLEQADGGTLFLDEIGDMSITMQAKVLKVIQERTIERIGDNKRIPIDIRIIAATNRNLEHMVENNTFRKDLYFRLSVIPIVLPPLRERKEDTPLLIDYFINKYNQMYCKNVSLSKKVFVTLRNYDWPGNVREISNVIEHAVVMCPAGTVKMEHLPNSFNLGKIKFLPDFESSSNEMPKLKYIVDEVEKKAILSALKVTNYNKTKAMDMLGLTRRIFYNKVNKYGINLKKLTQK